MVESKPILIKEWEQLTNISHKTNDECRSNSFLITTHN